MLGIALFQGLADAEHGQQSLLVSCLQLLHEGGIRFAEDVAALTVAQQHAIAADVLELRHGDLAGEGALGFEVGVLGEELHATVAELRLQLLEVDEGSGDAHFHAGLGFVAGQERGAEGIDVLREQVHFPVGDDDAHVVSFSRPLHECVSTVSVVGRHKGP